MKCPYCKKEINLKEMKMRSLPENRYYFGVVVKVLSDHLGYTLNEIHDILKNMFLSEVRYVDTKKGIKEIRVPKSTTELTTISFEQYLSDIRQWASVELSCYIPVPNETEIE